MAADVMAVVKNETVPEGLGEQSELLYKIADIVGERVAKDYETRSQQGICFTGNTGSTGKAIGVCQRQPEVVSKYKAFYSEGAPA